MGKAASVALDSHNRSDVPGKHVKVVLHSLRVGPFFCCQHLFGHVGEALHWAKLLYEFFVQVGPLPLSAAYEVHRAGKQIGPMASKAPGGLDHHMFRQVAYRQPCKPMATPVQMWKLKIMGSRKFTAIQLVIQTALPEITATPALHRPGAIARHLAIQKMMNWALP